MRSLAVPHEPAGGTMTGSPGRQSAGVATSNLSAVCRAMTTPQQLIEVAPQGQRIVDDGADYALRIDHENGPYRLGRILARHDHPVLTGYVHRDVFDKRKGDVYITHIAECDL